MINHHIGKDVYRQIEKFGTPIEIQRFNKVESKKDSIYHETKYKKYYNPVIMKAFVYFNPSEDIILEAGLDKDRTEIMVKIPKITLIKNTLITPSGEMIINTDDLLIIDEIRYNINQVKPSILAGEFHLYTFGARRI